MRVLKGVLEGVLTHVGTPTCAPWRAWKPSIAASAPSAFDGVTPIFDSSERGSDPSVPVPSLPGFHVRVRCALRAHGRVELAGGGGGGAGGREAVGWCSSHSVDERLHLRLHGETQTQLNPKPNDAPTTGPAASLQHSSAAAGGSLQQCARAT